MSTLFWRHCFIEYVMTSDNMKVLQQTNNIFKLYSYYDNISLFVVEVIGVGHWRWVTDYDICGICQLAFEFCCPDCRLPGDYCPIGIYFI